jgi:hypothetical protein
MLTKKDKSPIHKLSDIDYEIAQVNLIREIQKHYGPEVWKKVAFQEGLHEGLVWDKDLQLIMARSRQYRLNQR